MSIFDELVFLINRPPGTSEVGLKPFFNVNPLISIFPDKPPRVDPFPSILKTGSPLLSPSITVVLAELAGSDVVTDIIFSKIKIFSV